MVLIQFQGWVLYINFFGHHGGCLFKVGCFSNKHCIPIATIAFQLLNPRVSRGVQLDPP